MLAEGLPELVIRTFEHYHRQLLSGHTGLISESEIRPVAQVPDSETFAKELSELGASRLSKTVMIKLNGGLATGMGLHKAKSLLTVKDGHSFLDILAKQALSSKVPLVLMNSFKTRDDSLAALAHYPNLSGSLPSDFMQHKVPKVLELGLQPAQSPNAPELAWCPPGHGDLYTALVTTGTLDLMIASGYEYMFVSNADNLGAVMDPFLLGHFVSEKLPFLMEVADRTSADRKGGHLAEDLDGQLLVRESAQCPEDAKALFQDISRHRYFNTNNLWINLHALKSLMAARENVLGLSMIRNRKTLDPRDASSPGVYQLETAMGSAIAVFEGAGAVRVPRSRFTPVKSTNDLLAIRSDAYVLSDDFRVQAATDRSPLVDLDPKYYKLLDDMEARFPEGSPSLIDCESLSVTGDIVFGRNLRCEGRTEIVNESEEQVRVEDRHCTGRLVVA